MWKLAARAASFCGRCKPRPRPRLQQRHIRRNSQPLGGARGCEQPRCARGNPKAAAAGGNEDDEGARLGKSGAKAPDRNRARAAAPPRPRAAHEATATKLPTKHNTQFNGSEHTQCPPRKTYFTATRPAAPPGTGFPIPAQRSNQAHGRPSLPAQLHRHPLLQQHAAIRFDHIQIVDRPPGTACATASPPAPPTPPRRPAPASGPPESAGSPDCPRPRGTHSAPSAGTAPRSS